MPGRPPVTRALNQGYQYLTETRYGENEALLDKLRRHAQAMGMPVRSVEIEMGPSQFEFTFAAADPMTIADMAVNFRTMAREVCHREGLLASFMARPRLENAASNGWHIHQSLADADGRNLFTPGADGALTPAANGWIAGLLRHAAASCIATTPTVNGYKRYTAYLLAPDRIGWAEDNRGAMLRTLLAPGDPASRVENRVPDSTANPYFALAFQILSGLDGLENGLVRATAALPSPTMTRTPSACPQACWPPLSISRRPGCIATRSGTVSCPIWRGSSVPNGTAISRPSRNGSRRSISPPSEPSRPPLPYSAAAPAPPMMTSVWSSGT